MGATTTEGTGNGSVERYIPRTSFKNYQIQAENIIGIKKVIEENAPDKIDGGGISLMMMNLNKEDLEIIIRAAEIIKKFNI